MPEANSVEFDGISYLSLIVTQCLYEQSDRKNL